MKSELVTLCLIATSIGTLTAQLVEENSTSDSPTTENSKEDDQTQKDAPDDSRITDLPLLEDLTIPTAEKLLTKPKVTWIILKNQRVVVSRPVSPRPNTLERQREARVELEKQGTPANPEKREAYRDRLYELRRIRGGFIDAVEAPEFLIRNTLIEKIWHHEDLILKRADLLIEDEQFASAYDLLFALKAMKPHWPGLSDAYERLLFLEGQHLHEKQNYNEALTRFEHLLQLNKEYSDLSNAMAETSSRLIDLAIEEQDYRKARYYLRRLERQIPQAETITRHTERLKSKMRETLQAAQEALQTGEHRKAVLLATDAVKIWPADDELKAAHRKFSQKYQILRVGVINPAVNQSNFPFETRSEKRFRSLTQRELFEVDNFDDSPHYHTRVIEQWKPTELGRNLELTLRSKYDYWESQTPYTATDLAQTFRRQLAPGNSAYNEQLSGFIEGIRVRSPFRLELRFRRTPLRPEAVLSHSLKLQTQSGDWKPYPPQEGDLAIFQRVFPEGDEVPQQHVSEIQEHAFPNHEEILRALFRGEIDYIPDLQTPHVGELQEDPDWIVRKYQLPHTHLIQFRPGSLLAESHELRRAMLFAIDRRELLQSKLLREAPPHHGRLTTSVFPTQSRAYNPFVDEITPNRYVARSLVLTAEKSLQLQLPTFRMIVPENPAIQPVISELIKHWKRTGINVEAISASKTNLNDWDLAYRMVSITEPLAELWPFLTASNSIRVEDLQRLPGWLRQELIQLELSTNWENARQRLHDIHTSLWKEVYYLPLWEIDRFSLARRNLRGLPEAPVKTYQDVNRWVVSPWYERAQP